MSRTGLGDYWAKIEQERAARAARFGGYVRSKRSATSAPRPPKLERDAAATRRAQELDGLNAFLRAASSEFSHLAPERKPDESSAVTQASAILAAAALARAGGPPPPPPTGEAKRILDAAALAQAGGPARPAPTGLAAQILEAGKKARGE
jgi:hypothetical protein